jgi:transposase-like protein
VSLRVSPTERLRAEIDEVFASAGDLSDAVELVARLGARLLLQAAIETEVTVFLCRDRYARAALTEEARPGMRNRAWRRCSHVPARAYPRLRPPLARLLPAAVRCVLADRDSLTVYLRFPREHWTRLRHSNFIERTFAETRRRVKVIGRLPGEHACLSLVWAVLDRASVGWRRFTHDPGRAAAAARPAPPSPRPAGVAAPRRPPGGNAAPGQGAAVA